MSKSRVIRLMSAMGLAGLLLASGCVSSDPAPEGEVAPGGYLESGDLAAIERRGVLRVLVPAQDSSSALPRRGYPLDDERDLVRSFAEQNELEPHWIHVASRSELIPRLLDGQGDIIVANLTATPDRRERVSFTVPLRFVREQLVTRSGDRTIETPADLEGRRITIRRSSSFWATVQHVRRKYPGISVEQAPEDLDTEELVHRVAMRQIDLTLADSNLVESILEYRTDVRAACDLTPPRPIGWAVRPDSLELLRELNLFLTEAQIEQRRNEPRVEDLPEIRQRKVLRVLTRNSASTYFLWRGELVGFEYDLAREFARQHGLRVEVIVPPRGDDLLGWLVEGRGDLVAAGLTPAEEPAREDVVYSRPYNFVSWLVVARSSEEGLNAVGDLGGRRVFVRPGGPYWEPLRRLQDKGLPLTLEQAPEDSEPEEIIALVADGTYDLTVAYSHILDIELTWREDVRGAFALGETVPLAWAVRESNPELKRAVDAFLTREYRGLFYNVVYNKYFRDPKKVRRHVDQRIGADGALSPYDEIVKRHARLHDFDWRLIVAMMFQESRFDPDAHSFAGAVGLLQVLPRTAMQMGFDDLRNPERNIAAGVKYLAWLRNRFPEDLPVADRMWFALASYNAGHEHVRDARRIAVQEGWNPDRWFDNVEHAMPLLARAEYARRARHGYCRGSETVNYVREVSARYNAYREALDPHTTSAAAR